VVPGEKFDDDDELAQNVYYVPLMWATELVHKAREQKRILGDYALKTIIKVGHMGTDVTRHVVTCLHCQSDIVK